MCNIHLRGILEGEERERGTDDIFKIITTGKFPKLMSDIIPQIQKTQQQARKM